MQDLPHGGLMTSIQQRDRNSSSFKWSNGFYQLIKESTHTKK